MSVLEFLVSTKHTYTLCQTTIYDICITVKFIHARAHTLIHKMSQNHYTCSLNIGFFG